MELHKARVITSQAKSPSIQTTFWGGFRHASWAGPSARSSCCAGHKRSLSFVCPHPLLLYHRLLLLQVPKWLWLGFTRWKCWVTKLPISVASPFQTEPGVQGTGRAQQSLEIFSIISMAKKEILTKSSNKKRKSCTSCSCSEQNPLQLFLKRFLFKPSNSSVLGSLGCYSHSHRTNKETSFQKEATNCPRSKLLPGQ